MEILRGVGTKRRASSGSFTNHGGPVVASPQVHAIFWGQGWINPERPAPRPSIEQFLKDLLNSTIMNLLAQYGVGAGSYVGSMSDPRISGTLTDANIQSQLQAYFGNGTLPEPDGNSVHMIFFDENVEVDDPGLGIVMCEPAGDTAFGYHNFFATSKMNPAYYAVMPALDDTCVTESCSGSSGCTLSLSDTQLQRITEVSTHEFGELCSDPQLDAWTDASGNEIGDVCGGNNADITVGTNTWRVQKLWDNAAGQCTAGSISPVPSPQPPPPGKTMSSDVNMFNLIGYGAAKIQEIVRKARLADDLAKENAELKRRLADKT